MNFDSQNGEHDPNSQPLSEQELIDLIEKNASALREQLEAESAQVNGTEGENVEPVGGSVVDNITADVTSNTSIDLPSNDRGIADLSNSSGATHLETVAETDKRGEESNQIDPNIFSLQEQIRSTQPEKRQLDQVDGSDQPNQANIKRQAVESTTTSEVQANSEATHNDPQQIRHEFSNHNIESTTNQSDNSQIPQDDFSKLLEMNEADQLRFLTQHLQQVQEGAKGVEQNEEEEEKAVHENKELLVNDSAVSVKEVTTTNQPQSVEVEPLVQNEKEAIETGQSITPITAKENITTGETIPTTRVESSQTQLTPPITTTSTSNHINHSITEIIPSSEKSTTPTAVQDEPIITDVQTSKREAEEAKIILRSKTLFIIDNLASQILDTLVGKNSYQDTLNIVTQPESARGIVYTTLLEIFQRTKLIFSDEQFLTSSISGLDTNSRITKIIIQRVNLVTFLAAIFGSIEVGFYHLNEYFLHAFVPDNGKLLKQVAGFYLDLKTQAYISALSQNEKSKSEVLDDLFPSSLEQVLYSFRPDRTSLSPTEEDFIIKCKRRRARLEGEQSSGELAKTYQWLLFLKDLTEYVIKNHTQLIPPINAITDNIGKTISHINPILPGTVSATTTSISTTTSSNQPLVQVWNSHDKQLKDPTKPFTIDSSIDPSIADLYSSDTLTVYKAARRMMSSSHDKPEHTATPSTSTGSAPGPGVVGIPGTIVQTRRPWSTEEEEALILGIDTVKGPYWTQILELYGPGGSISEVLKDRNQVQLKDKARNLKMFFIKCGLPIPPSFHNVTGDINARKQTSKKVKEKKKEGEAATANLDHNTPPPPLTSTATTSGSSGVSTANIQFNNNNNSNNTLPTRLSTEADHPVQSTPLTDPNMNVDPMLRASHNEQHIVQDDAPKPEEENVFSQSQAIEGSFNYKNTEATQNSNDLQGGGALENPQTRGDNSTDVVMDNEDANNLEQLLQKVGDFINRGGVEEE